MVCRFWTLSCTASHIQPVVCKQLVPSVLTLRRNGHGMLLFTCYSNMLHLPLQSVMHGLMLMSTPGQHTWCQGDNLACMRKVHEYMQLPSMLLLHALYCLLCQAATIKLIDNSVLMLQPPEQWDAGAQLKLARKASLRQTPRSRHTHCSTPQCKLGLSTTCSPSKHSTTCNPKSWCSAKKKATTCATWRPVINDERPAQ